MPIQMYFHEQDQKRFKEGFINFLSAQSSPIDNKHINFGIWVNRASKGSNTKEKGLAIDAGTNSAEICAKIVKAFGFTNYSMQDNTLQLSFDDSLKIFQILRQHIKDDNLLRSLKLFVFNFTNQFKNFPLNSKVKPSAIYELFYEPLDFLNSKSFFHQLTVNEIPSNLHRAIEIERHLRYYDHAYGSSRFHLFEANLNNVRTGLNERDVIHFDESYKKALNAGIKGDSLKRIILKVIQCELSSCDGDLKRVKTTWEQIQKRYDYKLLAQSQGMTTKLLGIFGAKTSSIQALEKWLDYTYPDLKDVETTPKALR